ncbi:putative transcriptional regulator [Providencia alcalifaciens]|uniref:Phage protein n=1 Tax=Proteus genomosp. 6 TaxID=1311820 RepID=A0ABV1LDZ9_9GAMM|nr:putative transcriptional regulator [Providencia alcalifaciens]
MLEYEFKTVRELKDALNKFPDDAIVDISELPKNILRQSLMALYDGKGVLICEYHDSEKNQR